MPLINTTISEPRQYKNRRGEQRWQCVVEIEREMAALVYASSPGLAEQRARLVAEALQ